MTSEETVTLPKATLEKVLTLLEETKAVLRGEKQHE